MIDGMPIAVAIFQDTKPCPVLLKSKLRRQKNWAAKSSKPTDLWNNVRTITGTSVPNPIANLIDSFSNAKTAANAFNNHFTSVFVNSNNDIPTLAITVSIGTFTLLPSL